MAHEKVSADGRILERIFNDGMQSKVQTYKTGSHGIEVYIYEITIFNDDPYCLIPFHKEKKL